MKRIFVAVTIALLSRAAIAQSVAAAPDGSFVVAHDGVIERYAPNLRQRLWRATGVSNPGALVVGDRSAVILDPLANRAVVVDLATGLKRDVRTGETPIAAAFLGGELYILDRDARILERVGGEGARATVSLAANPAFLRVVGDTLLVYGRTSGSIQQITARPFAVAKTIAVAPFASDFEADEESAYLVYPRDGVIRATTLADGTDLGSVRIGSVPVDLTFASAGTALTPPLVAVADATDRRVWIYPKKQTFMAAFGRGFIRGLIGMANFEGRAVRFESGVDRVVILGTAAAAYDSSIGTLYSFSSKNPSVLARNLGPRAFAVSDGAIVWWQNGTLVAQKTNG